MINKIINQTRFELKTNYFHSVVDNQAILSNLFSGGSGRPLPGPFLRYDELKIINVGRNGRGVEKDPLHIPYTRLFHPRVFALGMPWHERPELSNRWLWSIGSVCSANRSWRFVEVWNCPYFSHSRQNKTFSVVPNVRFTFVFVFAYHWILHSIFPKVSSFRSRLLSLFAMTLFQSKKEVKLFVCERSVVDKKTLLHQ